MKPLTEFRIFFALLFVCLAISVYAVHQVNHRAYQQCQRVELLKSYNYANALRARKALPLSAYFIEHPEELRGALNNVAQQITDYRPRPCHASLI